MRPIFEDNQVFDLYMYTILEEEGGPKTDDAVYYLLGKHIWDYLTHFKKGEKDKQAQANYRKKYGINDDNPRDGLIRFAKHELYPIEDSKNEIIPRSRWDLKGICGETKKQIDHPHFEEMKKWFFQHYKPKHDILVIFPCANKKPYFENHMYKWFIERYKTVCDFAYVSNPGVIPNEYANYYPYRYYEWEERHEDHHKDKDGNDVQGPLMDYYDAKLQERFVEWVKHFKYKRVLICCPNPYVENFAIDAKDENDGNLAKRITILTDKTFLNSMMKKYDSTYHGNVGMLYTRMLNLYEFKDHFKRAVFKELSDKQKKEVDEEILKADYMHSHGGKEPTDDEKLKEYKKERDEKKNERKSARS